MPCHTARMLPGLAFPNVATTPVREIWYGSEGFNRYRGTGWMKEPCKSCPDKEKDFGGCRCQAFALTGDAANTDPACSLSPMHEEWAKVADVESHHTPPDFVYRRPGGATPKPARTWWPSRRTPSPPAACSRRWPART